MGLDTENLRIQSINDVTPVDTHEKAAAKMFSLQDAFM